MHRSAGRRPDPHPSADRRLGLGCGRAGEGAATEITLTAELVFWLIALFAVPVALLALIRPAGRLVFFFAGLLFMVVVNEAFPPLGPHNPMLLLPILGLFLAADAILAELVVQLVRAIRSRRRPRPDGIEAG